MNNKVPVGCGGVFLAIDPKLKDFVTFSGVISLERAVWAHVDHSSLGNIGILSLYAPNGSMTMLNCGMSLQNWWIYTKYRN